MSCREESGIPNAHVTTRLRADLADQWGVGACRFHVRDRLRTANTEETRNVLVYISVGVRARKVRAIRHKNPRTG